MKRFLIILTSLLLFSGCATRINVKVLQTYQFENVYSSDNKIVVNNEELKFSKKERVWIVTDRTLTYMMEAAKTAKKQNFKLSADVE